MSSKSSGRRRGVDRRSFLGQIGIGAASIAGLTAATPQGGTPPSGKNPGSLLDSPASRTARSYEVRMRAAELARNRAVVTQTPNGEETLYPARIASFSKGLPHNAFGEVEASAYDSYLEALSTGNAARLEAIPMGMGRKLTNPLAGMAFDLEGPDAHHLAQAPAPTIASGEGGSELGEVYWMALCRDVHFSDYGASTVVADAAADMSRFPDFRGPKAAGRVTPETIFRGSTPGDLVGPYLSQFLWQGFHMGALTVNQRVWTLPAGTEYLYRYEDWLAAQNGFEDYSYPLDSSPRYIRNLRDLGQWVHVDALYQAYHQACLILLDIGAPFAGGMPYRESSTQIGFGTFGGPHILSLVTEVATRALKAVWYQKWFVHRRLRPEAFAGLVHHTRTGRSYPVSQDVLNSSALDALYSRNGTYLLPTIAPEGAPTHPSYGAGHATVAGACVTILKAWFDNAHVLRNPVVPDASGTTLLAYNGPALTVGNELDKLAANVGIGRNGAGFHYRSDYWESLKLGEEIGVGILEEQRETYREICSFSFKGFEGQTITI
ncbi:MAG TPA: vanadium-dependent haloperoxidase [Thermoanaerobaculia bacterium]|nr:vanadium-dependent haloperoxidase [Thermoanaerobaculia bacterium]